ncbi:hypothetical protein A0H81_10985, partial [Grifola frondosa]
MPSRRTAIKRLIAWHYFNNQHNSLQSVKLTNPLARVYAYYASIKRNSASCRAQGNRQKAKEQGRGSEKAQKRIAELEDSIVRTDAQTAADRIDRSRKLVRQGYGRCDKAPKEKQQRPKPAPKRRPQAKKNTSTTDGTFSEVDTKLNSSVLSELEKLDEEKMDEGEDENESEDEGETEEEGQKPAKNIKKTGIRDRIAANRKTTDGSAIVDLTGSDEQSFKQADKSKAAKEPEKQPVTKKGKQIERTAPKKKAKEA